MSYISTTLQGVAELKRGSRLAHPRAHPPYHICPYAGLTLCASPGLPRRPRDSRGNIPPRYPTHIVTLNLNHSPVPQPRSPAGLPPHMRVPAVDSQLPIVLDLRAAVFFRPLCRLRIPAPAHRTSHISTRLKVLGSAKSMGGTFSLTFASCSIMFEVAPDEFPGAFSLLNPSGGGRGLSEKGSSYIRHERPRLV